MGAELIRLIAMFITGQPRIYILLPALLLFLFLLPQTIRAEEFTVLLPGTVPMTLVKVPAGTFLMGSPEGERGNVLGNETQHQVTLSHDYYLSKTEVTVGQWRAVTGTPMSMPTECPNFRDENDPVSCVSWDQIAGPGGFVEKLNQHLGTAGFRLPSEAEWERAARAGTTTRFAHGDALECNDECEYCDGHWPHMWYCGMKVLFCVEFDPEDTPQCQRIMALPQIRGVGWTQPNPFGLYDMHGNVWEWVQDRYGDYSPDDSTDPTGPEIGTDRVIRGGSWAGEARLGRSASRAGANPETFGIPANTEIPIGSDGFGFRIAISSVEGLGIQINAGLNDAWYNPLTDGQGFLITVFPDIRQMFVAWFTYDVERPPEDVTAMLGEPGHRWLTAQGPYSGDTANLTIYVTEGGVFDAADPPAQNDGIGDGTMTIEFADCTEGLVTYEMTSPSVSGEIPIQRITNDNVVLCETLASQ
jgi:formylglycine-generating enzyme required for sulfatase activity